MKSAKKMRPIPAMNPEAMALEVTHLSVNTLNSFEAARGGLDDWKLSKLAVGTRVGEEEGIKEGGRVDEVEVGKGVGVENTVLLIKEV
jgi:hypothetical protein